MGVRVYDPSGRIGAAGRRPSPWAQRDEEQQPIRNRSQVDDPVAALARTKWTSGTTTQKKDDDDKGLAESFFGSTVGKGLGVVLNNPVVKNLMQPLDVLGVPQRAIASTIQETADLVSGKGFSPQEWYDQTNPAYAFHGENAEDSIGMGDVWQEYSPLAGKNRYLDAAAGFVGDVATDPLTYAFGLGVVDKGLDGLRAGTRLGAALKGVDKVDDVAAAANKANRGTRMALSGRATRADRVSEAAGLIERADTDILNRLYGNGSDVTTEALQEIQRRAGRGLGAKSPNLSEGATELVETALNIKPPATRMRVPLGRGQGRAIPGSGVLAQKTADLTGSIRFGLADTAAGKGVTAARAPIDLERGMAVLARGERATPDEFSKASSVVRQVQGGRNVAGEYLNLGQRMVRSNRKQVLRDIKEAGGKQAYLQASEIPGTQTTLNRLFNTARDELAQRFGVTIPDYSGNLDYVPHVVTRKFKRSHKDVVDARLNEQIGRYGQGEQTLQKESGRFMARGFKPGETINFDGIELTIPESGTIADINQASEALGLGKMLEDDPLMLIDEYIQAVSEDVGRRAGRANMVAEGNPYVAYDPNITGQQMREALTEQTAAYERIGMEFDPNDLAPMARRIADGQLKALYGNELRKWKSIGENRAILQDPGIDMMLKNIAKQINENPNIISRALRTMNRYFKTFAVLSPGFHVRNGMSAIFMNMADGVPMPTTIRGMNLWHDFSKAAKGGDDMLAGMDFIDGLEAAGRQTDADALRAVFGSGAGGRFTEADVGEGFGRFGAKIMENPLTRKSQDAGAWVEGSVRTGMALDTLENGGNLLQAQTRITRVHFDYSQVSRFDDQMKQFIPFWSFMSRNMPLQVMQQWSRPRAYMAYEHFKDNFEDEEALAAMGGREALPDYIAQGGGMATSIIPGMNWIEPDLQHTRVYEDVERFANILSDPMGATSSVSPVFTAPLEYGTATDFFTGQKFGEDDYEMVTNPLELLAVLPAAAFGQVRIKDGEMFIKTEALNALEALDPNFARVSRLTGSGGQEPARRAEGWLRYFGAPVRNITERQLSSAETGRYYDDLDLRRIDEALAQQARGG